MSIDVPTLVDPHSGAAECSARFGAEGRCAQMDAQMDAQKWQSMFDRVMINQISTWHGGHASEALSERTPEMDEQVEGPGNGDDLAFNAEKTPGEATQDADRRESIAAACCTARPVCSAFIGRWRCGACIFTQDGSGSGFVNGHDGERTLELTARGSV